MKFLKRVQKLSDNTKKAIIVLVVILLGGFLIFFWVQVFFQNWKGLISSESIFREFKIPSLRQKLEQEMPDFQLPGDPPSINVPEGMPETGFPDLENE